MYRILHISDIHFGPEHAFQQARVPREARGFCDAITLALAENEIETDFDAIVISGDVFTNQQVLEQAEARLQLSELRERLGNPLLALVPGNHDVDWRADPAQNLHIYERLVSELGAEGSTAEMPIILTVESGEQRPLALILLDSCRIEGEAQRGLGCVGEPQCDSILAKLRQAGIDAQSHTLIAVMHHHLLPMAAAPVLPHNELPSANEDRLKISATVDASQVLTRLGELGVAAVLHGHQHIGSAVDYGRLHWQRPPLHLIAAGSAGARGPNLQRQFWVIELSEEGADVTSLLQHPEDVGRFRADPAFSGHLPFS
jgi:3',5'-cyclic AMP phosphodiesterase CpdA